MKRAIVLVLMSVLLVISGTVTGCSCEEDGGETAQSEMEVKGLEIQVNRAYFAIVADWYENLIVETTLYNKGGEARYLNFFLPESTSLFLQDGDGTTYRNTQAFTSWKEGRDRLPEGNVDSLRLEPGEMRTLMLRFDDVPKDVDGLKLVCVLYTDREHRASVKVEIQGEPTNGESSEEPDSTTNGQVYTKAPGNPEEPAEVLAAFWFWVSEGKEREAESFVAAEWISEYRSSLDELEDQFGGKVQKVIVVETAKDGETAESDFILYLDGDGPESLTAYYIKENGEWKLDFSEDAGKKVYTEDNEQKPEDLFKLAMEKMNKINSLRMTILGEDPASDDAITYNTEVSDNFAKVHLFVEYEGIEEAIEEAIIIYPDKYFTSDGITWEYDPGPLYEYYLGFIFTGLIHFVFPQPDVPIEYYEVTLLENEFIDGVETNHFRVMADWRGIYNWLDAEGRISEVAYFMFEHDDNVYEVYDINNSYIDIWIDNEGFVRRIHCDSEQYCRHLSTWVISAEFYDFNEAINIEAPSTTAVPAPTPTTKPTPAPKTTTGPEPETTPENSIRIKLGGRLFI